MKYLIFLKLNGYKPIAPNKIDTKNKLLTYLKFTKNKLIYMFSTLTIIRKIDSVNYKGHVHNKLNK